jgi:hypothetical protein
MRKGKDPDQDPYLGLTDPDPGGPKTCGSGPAPFPTQITESALKTATFAPISSNKKKWINILIKLKLNQLDFYDSKEFELFFKTALIRLDRYPIFTDRSDPNLHP